MKYYIYAFCFFVLIITGCDKVSNLHNYTCQHMDSAAYYHNKCKDSTAYVYWGQVDNLIAVSQDSATKTMNSAAHVYNDTVRNVVISAPCSGVTITNDTIVTYNKYVCKQQ